jgi:thymidylate kinase
MPTLRPESLIVFEGLDRSGKSTQRRRLEELDWTPYSPTFTHLPSGETVLTQEIYRLMEDQAISSGLARQLLHLACHAENIAAIATARRTRGVLLDRWWWSTVAYGWYGAHLRDGGLTEDAFFGVIDAVWSAQPADLVFLFMTPYENDLSNRDDVRKGYLALAEKDSPTTVIVPPDGPAETTRFIISQLRERSLMID